jgi:hypothetical protein
VEIPFLDILRSVDPDFQPVPSAFAPRHPTRFALGDRYRVDILTPMQGASDDTPVALPALKTDAQPLRFIDFLIYREVPPPNDMPCTNCWSAACASRPARARLRPPKISGRPAN